MQSCITMAPSHQSVALCHIRMRMYPCTYVYTIDIWLPTWHLRRVIPSMYGIVICEIADGRSKKLTDTTFIAKTLGVY